MMSRSLAIAVRMLVETVLPARCPACDGPLGRHIGGVCLACWAEVAGAGGGRQDRPFRTLASLTTLGAYEGRLRRIIRCLKFRGLCGLGDPLGERLAARLAPIAGQVDLVVPVPLHRMRRWRRGYNQAELVAAGVARALHRPLSVSALRRRRSTASQRGRSRRARVANVRGAFAARPGWLERRRVLLVDDVVTTGATLRECARALTAAGARTVHAAAPARTLTHIGS